MNNSNNLLTLLAADPPPSRPCWILLYLFSCFPHLGLTLFPRAGQTWPSTPFYRLAPGSSGSRQLSVFLSGTFMFFVTLCLPFFLPGLWHFVPAFQSVSRAVWEHSTVNGPGSSLGSQIEFLPVPWLHRKVCPMVVVFILSTVRTVHLSALRGPKNINNLCDKISHGDILPIIGS